MAVRDRLEGCLEIGEGLDTVDLRGLDQGGDAVPCLASLVVAREERVFAVQSDRIGTLHRLCCLKDRGCRGTLDAAGGMPM